MARKILIVDSSATMRRILGNMILANINDAEFVEARDAEEAWNQVKSQDFHLMLFSWEPSGIAWLDFFQRLEKRPGKPGPASIFLVAESSRSYLDEALKVGVSESVAIPCTQVELTEAINRACNPITLRHSSRYSLPGTTAILRQERRSHPALVVNISKGGLLCELEYAEEFQWTRPVMIDITFKLNGEQLTAPHLYSIPSRFSIVATNADLTPRRVKMACRFFNIPAESLEVMNKAFKFADEQEKMFASPAG